MAKTKTTKRTRGVTLDEALAPADKDSWRLIVDFPLALMNEIRSESERLGINMQAVVKTLVDEALRARKRDLKKGA